MKKLAPLRVEAYCPECRQQASLWVHPLMWHRFAKLDLDPDREVLEVKCHAPGCGAHYWIKLRAMHRARPDLTEAA